MKNKFLLIALFWAFTNTAQSLTESFLIGTWKVKKATTTNNSATPETNDLLEGFKKGTYQFLPNHSFVFTTTGKGKLIAQFTKMLAGNKWLWEPKKSRVGIGFKKDGYSTLGIQIITDEKKVVFVLEEIGIQLTMKKM